MTGFDREQAKARRHGAVAGWVDGRVDAENTIRDLSLQCRDTLAALSAADTREAQLRASVKVALGESPYTACLHSVTVWTCAGCIVRRVRAALAVGVDGDDKKAATADAGKHYVAPPRPLFPQDAYDTPICAVDGQRWPCETERHRLGPVVEDGQTG